MTSEDVANHVWAGLPMFRRSLLGRREASRFIRIAVAESPLELMQHVQAGSDQEKIVAAAWRNAVKRRYCISRDTEDTSLGPLFWIVVGPILQCIVERLLEMWFSDRRARIAIAAWRRELTV